MSLAISITALLVSIIGFFWNVYDRLLSRAEERKRRAPFLSASLEASVGPNSADYTFTTALTNAGVNPATDVTGELVLAVALDIPLEKESIWRVQTPVHSFGNVNGLAASVPYTTVFKVNLPHMPRQWVRLSVKYNDALTNKPQGAEFGFLWGGTDNGRRRSLKEGTTQKPDRLSRRRAGCSP